MPQLSWDGYRFTLVVSSAEKETVKSLGFHFDLAKLVWWTSLPIVAKNYQMYADQRALTILNADSNRVALSKSVHSNFNIPCPDGLEYLSFQKIPAEYAQGRSNILIADCMGSGKTIEACGVINSLPPSAKRILVVCPATLRLNWSSELMKWLVRPLSGGFIYEKTYPDDTDILITSYDMVKKYLNELRHRKWDVIIADESHMIKSFGAIRTRALLGGEIKKVEYPPIDCGLRIFMTGTPILNRPHELWPMLSVGDPDGLGVSEWNFINTYMKPWESPWGTTEYSTRKDTLDELQERLRSSMMIRRAKADILPFLPPKRRQIIALPPETAKKAVQAELQFYQSNTELIQNAIKRAEETQAGDDLSYEEAAKDLKKGRSALLFEMSKLRRLTGIAKIPFVIEYLEQALEQEEKVVCFAHHTEVIETLGKHFGNIAVIHHGGMSDTKKVAARERFQGTHLIPADPKCKLFISAITISIGFDLTVARLACCAELDWRPAIMSQAEDRLHRIGQHNPVQIVHLIFDQSLDSNMVKKIVSKQEIIDLSLN